MKFFHSTTVKTEDCQRRNMVVMGRKTWESIPEARRPLAGRRNIVISKNKDFKAEGAEVRSSLEEALKATDDRIDSIFVIGGAKVYEQAIRLKEVKGVYLTRLRKTYDCDAFFPKTPSFGQAKKLGEAEEGGVAYEFFLLTRGERGTGRGAERSGSRGRGGVKSSKSRPDRRREKPTKSNPKT